TSEWKDFIPGPNTSGADYQVGLSLTGDTTSETPTSTHDWISPIIGESAGLSINRARRTKQIFEDFGCPSTYEDNQSVWLGGGSPPDRTDFDDLLANGGIRQVSYLSPASFHYYPTPQAAQAHSHFNRAMLFGHQTPVEINPNYIPT